jgi:hypothetical protein
MTNRPHVAAAALAAALLACAPGQTSPDGGVATVDDVKTVALALEQGLLQRAMDTSDEPPDLFLARAQDRGADTDPAAACPDAPPAPEAAIPPEHGAALVSDLEARVDATAPTVFHLLVGWGHFPPLDGAPDIPFAGSLSSDMGALVAAHRVATDRVTAMDRLVRDPTTPARALNLDGSLGTHLDGTVVRVVLHELLAPASALQPRQATVALERRGGGRVEARLSPEVWGVSARGDVGPRLSGMVQGFRRVDRPSCQQGFLVGRWSLVGRTADGRTVGRLVGRWLDGNGDRVGLVRGVHGERRNGEQVLYAKVVGTGGAFLGLLAADTSADTFSGAVQRDATAVAGHVEGRFAPPASLSWGSLGEFRGRWSLGCGENPDEQ